MTVAGCRAGTGAARKRERSASSCLQPWPAGDPPALDHALADLGAQQGTLPPIPARRAPAVTWPPAHLAVEQQDLPRLRDLLDAGHDDGHGWTLLRHAIDVERDGHVQTGGPLHADVTAFLLLRGGAVVHVDSRTGELPAGTRRASLPFPPPPDEALDQLRRQYIFGDHQEDFERDLRKILAQASPSGRFSVRLPDNVLRIWRPPGRTATAARQNRPQSRDAIHRSQDPGLGLTGRFNFASRRGSG